MFCVNHRRHGWFGHAHKTRVIADFSAAVAQQAVRGT
jgi:hypothetical protein